jgi:hypothetical protein
MGNLGYGLAAHQPHMPTGAQPNATTAPPPPPPTTAAQCSPACPPPPPAPRPAAKAIAAFEGRDVVAVEDVYRVIPLCLRHRLRKDPLADIDSGDKVGGVLSCFGGCGGPGGAC